eukprot:765798-Pelagomonas_calceolata.AAC.5
MGGRVIWCAAQGNQGKRSFRSGVLLKAVKASAASQHSISIVKNSLAGKGARHIWSSSLPGLSSSLPRL